MTMMIAEDAIAMQHKTIRNNATQHSTIQHNKHNTAPVHFSNKVLVGIGQWGLAVGLGFWDRALRRQVAIGMVMVGVARGHRLRGFRGALVRCMYR